MAEIGPRANKVRRLNLAADGPAGSGLGSDVILGSAGDIVTNALVAGDRRTFQVFQASPATSAAINPGNSGGLFGQVLGMPTLAATDLQGGGTAPGIAALCVSASSGDVSPGRAEGVFSRDMRLVSHCELLIGGEPVEPMAVVPAHPFSATFVGKLAVHG